MSKAVIEKKKPALCDSEITKIHNIDELLELLALEKVRRARIAQMEPERG